MKRERSGDEEQLEFQLRVRKHPVAWQGAGREPGRPGLNRDRFPHRPQSANRPLLPDASGFWFG